MERLTKPDWNKPCYDACELCGMYKHCTRCEHEDGGCCHGCHILEIHRKLAEYEDLEEQGLLLRLPCKIGDITYWISAEDEEGNIGLSIKKDGPITAVTIKEDGYYICTEKDGDLSCSSKIGSRYALLTREQAEQKLKELEVKQ